MPFIKYQHIERLGTTEVENIELGECYVFPKIDGTNSSVWLDEGTVQAGSRNNHLVEHDNANFKAYALSSSNIINYLLENPTHRLFGEWLVPHSLKTYRATAWKNFYVFDVCVYEDNEYRHLHYEEYKPLLEKHQISYIPPICKITNGSYEQFIDQLQKNVFLIEDGKGIGEGIVIKRYDFKNKYGRQIWAKIVTSEFKEKHAKVMGASDIQGKKMIEEEIAIKYVTEALVEKEYSKIAFNGWSSKDIPQLLNTVFHCLITEEMWQILKEFKNPKIDFRTLQHFVYREVKVKKSNIF